MLRDLFFENAIFKYFYFQDEEFNKQFSPEEMHEELASLNFARAKDTQIQNKYLLKSSLE